MATIRHTAAGAVALVLLAACGADKSTNEAAPPAPSSSSTPSSTPSATPSATASAMATPGPGAGPTQALGMGSVWAYVNSDSSGKPLEVGVRLTGAALNGLPKDMGAMGHPTPIVLNFPSGVSAGVLNHVEFYWNPTGHEPPGVWDKPHFDYHFYMVDPAEVHAIDPANPDFATKAAKVPDAKYIPTDFVAPPGTAVENTIPGMGLHYSDKTEPPIPGQYKFTETMINGSYDGRYTFIEPMITREWLLSHTALEEPIKQPEAYQKAGMYPTTYKVSYDAGRDEYSVSLGGFKEREAS